MVPLLEVNHLQVSFETYLGEVQAVRDASFCVHLGETVALVGESGCGKSVTAMAIMGLIQSASGRVDGGSILFEGQDLLKKTRKEMSRIQGKEIGMIFQDPMTSLNPMMRIGKQIMEVLLKHTNVRRGEAKAR